MKKLLAVIPMILALTGCFSDDVTFMLDNPTTQTINIEVDDKPFVIEGGTYQNVTLSPGEHRIKLISGPIANGLQQMNGQLIEFTVYPEADEGVKVINPTLSNYVRVMVVYATSEESSKNYSPISKKIVIDNRLYDGPFELFNTLFLDGARKPTFDLTEPLPDSISTRRKQEGDIKSKLYRQNEFIEYYKQDYGKAPTTTEPAMIPTLEVTSFGDVDLSGFDSLPEFKAKAQEYVNKLKQRNASFSSSERQKLHKEAVMIMTGMLQNFTSQDPKVNQTYDDLIKVTNDAYHTVVVTRIGQ